MNSDHPRESKVVNELIKSSAVELAAAIRAGELQPTDVLAAHDAHISEREPTLHAFSFYDAEGARRQLEGLQKGRLHGIPVAVKDVIDVAGMPAAYGSPIWQGHVPRSDSAAVALLRREGALIIGKTVTTEFAVRHPGPTVHALNPAHTPGGSSSGSAAGLAAGLFPLALGTQTAGSVIRPSAYCGVVGYKPTFGWIPRSGMKATSDSLDTIGPMARSVADVALLASVLTGRDYGDVSADVGRPLRVGVCGTVNWGRVDLPMQQRFGEVIAELGALAVLKDCELPAEFEGINDLHATVQYRETAMCLAWELATHSHALSPWLRQTLAAALAEPIDAYHAAIVQLQALRSRFDAFLSEQQVDVLLTPSAAGEAPAGLDSTGEALFNRAWTALHAPCINLPVGKGPGGLPLGVQLVGRRHGDVDLLRVAAHIHARLLKVF